MRLYLERLQGSGHLVVRGTYLPDTTRCATQNVYRNSRGGEFDAGNGLAMVTCYADIRVNEYLLGSGPASLTAVVGRVRYQDRSLTDPAEQEERRRHVERKMTEGGDLQTGVGFSVPEAA